MKDDLTALQADIKSTKRTFSQRIHSELVNSNKTKYISPDGVINWMTVNSDSKKIERICNGIVPGPSEDLQAVIAKHDSQEELACTPASSKSKFVKELWAKKGLTFPGSGPLYWSPEKSYNIPAPSTREEENYQMELAIRESQRGQRDGREKYRRVSPQRVGTSLPDYSRAMTANLPDYNCSYTGAPPAYNFPHTMSNDFSPAPPFAYNYPPVYNRLYSHTVTQGFPPVDRSPVDNLEVGNYPVDHEQSGMKPVQCEVDVSEENPLSILANAANLFTED